MVSEFGILHVFLGAFMWVSGHKFLTQLPDQLAFFKGSGDRHFEKKVLLSHMDIWRVGRKIKNKEKVSCMFALEAQNKEQS